METTANIAEIEQVNALTLTLFSTPRSQQNFSPAEKSLLKKYRHHRQDQHERICQGLHRH